jgi:hypothetical protein
VTTDSQASSLALWQRYCPEKPIPPILLVLLAAGEALKLLADGWRRQPFERRDCDEYAPEAIRYWLTGGHWRMLDEGPKSTAPGVFGTGGDPHGLAHIKSDLEGATDQALTSILHWYAVAKIYKREERFDDYLARRASFKEHADLEPEPSIQPIAEAICFERMARCLGWVPLERIA